MPRVESIICGIAGLCFTAFAAQARADEPLRWKFETGERLGYNVVQEMTISNVEQGAEKLQSKTRQQLDVAWQVKEIEGGGNGVIVVEFERIRSEMTLPSGHLEYDSGKEGPPAGMAAINAPLYAALVKSPVEIVLSPAGEIQSVSLPDAVQAGLKRVQTAAALGDLAQPATFQALFMPAFPQLPAKPVEPGFKWSIKSKADLGEGGKQTIETDYQYDGTKEIDGATCAVIRVTRTIGFEPGQTSQRGVKEQSSEGQIVFDARAGRLRSATLIYRATVAVKYGKQELDQKLNQTIDVKSVIAPPKQLMDARGR